MSLYKIVRSKTYKNFMAKLYGIGASIVISGALFKILHWRGADLTLMVGMFTEALIFFCSAFEPLHKEYDWALVYPELGVADDAKGKGGTVSQQLDRMLSEAKIGPELIESLACGMKNLSENAKKLSNITDAAAVTEGYVAHLAKAKDAVQNLAGVYEKSATEINANSTMHVKSIQEMFDTQKQYAQKLHEVQVQNTQKIEQIQEQGNQTIIEGYKKMQSAQDQGNQTIVDGYKKLQNSQEQGNQVIIENCKKLGQIHEQGNQSIVENYNKLGQIQEQGHQAIIENYKKIQDSSAVFANTMNESTQEALKHKQEIDKLSKQVAQINAIYANMLAAMTNK